MVGKISGIVVLLVMLLCVVVIVGGAIYGIYKLWGDFLWFRYFVVIDIVLVIVGIGIVITIENFRKEA